MDLLVIGGLVCVALAVVVAVALVLRRSRVLRADVDRSRAEVAQLTDAVQRLSSDLAARDAVPAAPVQVPRQQEYVITSLGEPDDHGEQQPTAVRVRLRPPPSALVQERLVAALARRQTTGGKRSLAVDAVVATVALGHGVRRALTPDVLDRAAAESHVARRRSRRERKQELREAKRLARELRAQRAAQRTTQKGAA